MEPDKEFARTYCALMRYSRQFNDFLTGPAVDVDSFKKNSMEFCTLTLQIRKKDEEPVQPSWNSSTCYQVTLMLLTMCMH